MTSGSDNEDGGGADERSSDGTLVIDLAGRGSRRVPLTVPLMLPPHLAFLIHRDSDRNGEDFTARLTAMVVEYLEAYYEDDLVALDDEQLKLFGLGHYTVAPASRKE